MSTAPHHSPSNRPKKEAVNEGRVVLAQTEGSVSLENANCSRTRTAYDREVRSLVATAALGGMFVASLAAAALFAASAAALAGAPSVSGVVPGRNGEIVFASVRSARGPYRFFDLYLIRPDGTKLRRITRGRPFERYPAWSPDGKWIAYVSDRSKPGNDGAYEIYVMRPNGTGLRRVTHDRWTDDQLAWSPDGKQLVFSSSRASGTFGISVMNVNGTGYRRLTRDLEGVPAWSPDGTTIAYDRYNPAAGTSGIHEIWLMNPDGTNRRQLTFPPQHEEVASLNGQDSMPDWSPNGSEIAFVRHYRGRSDIYVIRADGSGLRRLTNTNQAGQHSWPAWSPDGKRIVFVSVSRRKPAIYTMNADGSHPKRLTTGGIDYAYPDWQPLR
jgi:Tol biopolymer transport system component